MNALLNLALAVCLLSSSNGQDYRSCSIPAVCTRTSSGARITTWRPIPNPNPITNCVLLEMAYCLVIGLVLAFALAINGQDPLHSCIVPTYCRRGGEGPPEAIWTDLNGNVIVPPSDFVTTMPPTPPTTTAGEPQQPQMQSDNAQVQDLRNYIETLSEPGWFLGIDGYQFHLSPPQTFVTYSVAKSFCAGLGSGSELASDGLNTADRRSYVIDNFLNTCINTHAVWIDLTDREEEGVFRWEDGDEITPEAAAWRNGQPDNYNGADCTVIANGERLEYDDVPCENSQNGILCQRFIGLPP